MYMAQNNLPYKPAVFVLFFIRHVKATSFHTKDERQRKIEIYVAAFVLRVLVKLTTTSKLNPLRCSTAKVCTCASTMEFGTGKIWHEKKYDAFFWRRVSRMKSACCKKFVNFHAGFEF